MDIIIIIFFPAAVIIFFVFLAARYKYKNAYAGNYANSVSNNSQSNMVGLELRYASDVFRTSFKVIKTILLLAAVGIALLTLNLVYFTSIEFYKNRESLNKENITFNTIEIFSDTTYLYKSPSLSHKTKTEEYLLRGDVIFTTIEMNGFFFIFMPTSEKHGWITLSR